MIDLRLHYLRQIGGHPVQALLEKAIDHEKASGVSPAWRSTFPSYDLEAVYFAAGDQPLNPVAAMSFDRVAWKRAISVAWAYVQPEFRRQGLHTRLFEAVTAIAARDGYLRVHRYVNSSNAQMIAAIERQGAKLFGCNYEFEISRSSGGSISDAYGLPEDVTP